MNRRFCMYFDFRLSTVRELTTDYANLRDKQIEFQHKGSLYKTNLLIYFQEISCHERAFTSNFKLNSPT